MFRDDNSTIAAPASALARGGRLVVRLSGSASLATAGDICHTDLVRRRQVLRVRAALGGGGVPCRLLVFPGPASYTGEDVVEFHLPGSPFLWTRLSRELVRRGCRHAEAGEFTWRAFSRGQIGLSRVEAVAQAIAAQGEVEMVAAQRLRGGGLQDMVQGWTTELLRLVAAIEASLDFSEDVGEPDRDAIAAALRRVNALIAAELACSAKGDAGETPSIVLAGWPNAGKSRLMNALLGRERSIVHATEGTTRDAVSAEMRLGGQACRLVDLPGVEAGKSAFSDSLAAVIGRAAGSADILVLVREVGDQRPAPSMPRMPDLVVASKCDLGGLAAQAGALRVSSVMGEGVEALRAKLAQLTTRVEVSSRAGLLQRHRMLLAQASESLIAAASAAAAQAGWERVSADAHRALDALAQVEGGNPDILEEVFSRFCLGK